MGFRTTLTTEDLGGIKLPKWFIEKWQKDFNFGEHSYRRGYWKNNTLMLSSKGERKMYNSADEEIFLDIQKILIKKDIKDFVVVLLHECGGITRVQIEKESIRLSEPTEWKEVEQIEHDYCYGCSDIKKVTES